MWQVIGQPKTIRLLERSFKSGSLSHAYLIVGPPRVGKGTLAANIAQALNCTGALPPCGECPSCRRIAAGKHADVRAVNPADLDTDEKTRQKIGTDIIEELQYSAALPPYEGKYRVFIIDGAENMSVEASNRLLKVLEEPSPTVVWLLLSSEERRLLPTVVSRCQRLEPRPVPAAEISALLRERHGVEAGQAELLSHLAAGCPGWAVSAAADSKLLESRNTALDALAAMLGAGLDDRLQYAAETGRNSEKDRRAACETLKVWQGFWRDAMLVKNGCASGITSIDRKQTLDKLAASLTTQAIKSELDRLDRSINEITHNVNAQLALEVLLINMPGIPSLASESTEALPSK
jgi:DNA polymerase-3 subunit delta'